MGSALRAFGVWGEGRENVKFLCFCHPDTVGGRIQKRSLDSSPSNGSE